jgi:hypothetical protein
MSVAAALLFCATGVSTQARTSFDFCVAIHSPKFPSQNRPPVAYRFRWCAGDEADCTKWTPRRLSDKGGGFHTRTHCFSWHKPVEFQIRFDHLLKRGRQDKTHILKPQRFRYRKNHMPSAGCITAAAFHFENRNRTLTLYQGPPPGLKKPACRLYRSN